MSTSADARRRRLCADSERCGNMALGRKNIEFRDNSDKILELLQGAKRRGLIAIGLAAEGHAKKRITDAKAVDTGRLRNSITYALAGEEAHVKEYRGYRKGEGEEKRAIGKYEGNAPGQKGDGVYIGTNVSYATGIETGSHRKAGGVHFLQDAASNHSDEYKNLMENSIKNA